MPEPRGKILPFYFVGDHSASMSAVMPQFNAALTELLETLKYESFAASKVRLCIIGFNDAAGVVLPMSDLRYVEAMPVFDAYSSTSYKAAFDLLALQIPSDVMALKAEGYVVNRPVVFFLTDGYPNKEDWRSGLQALLSIPAYPTILAFGVDQADPATIVQIARPGYAFQHNGEGSVGAAISAVIDNLTQSIVQSGYALAQADTQLNFEHPANFTVIDIDAV